jgi:Fe-S cluster assembly protein SufD
MRASFQHVEEYLEQAEQTPRAGFVALREQAANDLQAFGFPALKTEKWKYSNPKSLLREVYRPATASTAAGTQQAWLAEAHQILIINGQLQAELNIAGVRLVPIDQAPELGTAVPMAEAGFTALNTLLFTEGYYLQVSSAVDKPIHIIQLATDLDADQVVHTRNLIKLDAAAKVSVIEQYISANDELDYWRNSVTEVKLAGQSHLHYYKLQQEALAAKHTAFISVQQAASSTLTSFNLDLGGKFVRNDLHTALLAEQAQCELFGAYLARDKQHMDNHTVIEHACAHTFSNELYKGVLDNKAHGVFNGRVLVQADAQKVDSAQHNANLLLSRECEIDTKPELEIYADDVKCAHGATVGQLDDKALFYMQSRGVSLEIAEKLLTFGFAHDVVEKIEDETIQAFFTQHLAHWFVADAQLQELML